MAQSVVYADLKFAPGPSAVVADDDDSPYENVPLGTVTAAPSPGGKRAAAAAAGTARRRVVAGGPRGDACGCSSLTGRWTRRWRVPTALLAASLLLVLLLLVAVVALGACYWQVSRSLQDTSREHTAEQGRLSQELKAQEQSLEQTQLELARATEHLQRVWHEGNITQMELKIRNAELGHIQQELNRRNAELGHIQRELNSRNAELGHTQQELVVLQEAMQVVQGKLKISESTVSSLHECMYTDCCPRGWVLYVTKCLYISLAKKTWSDSQQDCSRKSARLLAQDE
ncbi:CD72 protein, partial [Chaetops frenatus]|nr:CD72 protein [Chaetops frenatus]